MPDVSRAGTTWTLTESPTAQILGGQLVPTGSSTIYSAATIETWTANGIVAMDWTPAYALGYTVGGLMLRAVDDTNYVLALVGNQGVGLYRVLNGVTTTLGTAQPPISPGTPVHVEAHLAGATVELWINGTRYLRVTESALQSATRHGVRWWPSYDWLSTMDNFSMRRLTQGVLVSPASVTVAAGDAATFSAHLYDAMGEVPNSQFVWSAPAGAGDLMWVSSSASTISLRGVLASGPFLITATAHTGETASAQIIVDSSRTRVLDRFTGANDTPLASHGPDVALNGGWAKLGTADAWLDQYRASAEYQNTAVLGVVYAIDSGVTDGTIGVDWHPAASGTVFGAPMGGLVFRVQDSHNYWVASYGFGAPLALWMVVNGQWYGPMSWTSVADPVGRVHRLEVKLHGPEIDVWWDGEQKLAYNDVYMWGMTATRHGLIWDSYSDWISTFDNFSVTGAPPCVTAVTPYTSWLPAAGGTGTLTVNAPAGCAWTAAAQWPWVTFPSGASGTGNGTVSYTVSGNLPIQNTGGYTRTSQIVVDHQSMTVYQPPLPDPCHVTVNPGNGQWVSVSDADQEHTLHITTALDGCYWMLTAQSTYPQWLHILDPDGTNGGFPRYHVDQNTSPELPRDGTITVTGPSFAPVTINVYQAADDPPVRTINCRVELGVENDPSALNPNDTIDDTNLLQQCFNRARPGDTIELDPPSPFDPGKGYIVGNNGFGQGLILNKSIRITSSGRTATPSRTAIIVAGEHLSDRILNMPTYIRTQRFAFTIEYITFEGRGDRDNYRSLCNANVALVGSGFIFDHNEVKHSCIGNGLLLIGNNYVVSNNYVAYNGLDQFDHSRRTEGGPWADGMTVVSCDHGTISDNLLVDNTDIDLVVGSGPSCTVTRNEIIHAGKYAFSGLNVGIFGDPQQNLQDPDPSKFCHGILGLGFGGCHQNSQFFANTIRATQPDRLGHALSIGTHPWLDPDKKGSPVCASDPSVNTPGGWVVDAGTVTNNTITGGNVNLLIEGWGVPTANPETHCLVSVGDAYGGHVFGNTMSDPNLGWMPGPNSTDCRVPKNYAVNREHAKGIFEHNEQQDSEFPFGLRPEQHFSWDDHCEVGTLSGSPAPFRLRRPQ